MTPNMKYLKKVKVEVDKLQSLLKEPEPGIMTWCLMHGNQMQKIADFWYPNKKSSNWHPDNS